MFSSLLSLIPSIIGMFSSNKSTKGYQAELEEASLQQKQTQASLTGTALLAENATRGKAGHEATVRRIKSVAPEKLGQAKDLLSGGGVVDYLTNLQAQEAGLLEKEETENENVKRGNIERYAQALLGPISREQRTVSDNKTDLELAGAFEGASQTSRETDYLGAMVNALLKGGTSANEAEIALLSKKKKEQQEEIDPSSGFEGSILSKLFRMFR